MRNLLALTVLCMYVLGTGSRVEGGLPGQLAPQVVQEHYALVYADLVLRVTIVGLDEYRVPPTDAGYKPKRELPPYITAAVMVVRVQVEEVLRGEFTEASMRFAVPWGSSDFGHNYSVGDEAIVSLVMRRDVLGGMWTLLMDSGRYLTHGDSWVVQGGRDAGTAYTPTTIRAIATSVSLDRVIRDADVIVIGTITHLVHDKLTPDSQSVLRVVRASVLVDRAIVGQVEKTISIEWARGGNYWPEWRVEGPDSAELSREYLLLLTRHATGFVPTYGRHGIVVIEDDGLLASPSGASLARTLLQFEAHVREVRER